VSSTARLLITAGLVLVGAGLLLPWLSRLPLGHLPGDLLLERSNLRFYFPIATCALVSVVASLLFWFLRR